MSNLIVSSSDLVCGHRPAASRGNVTRGGHVHNGDWPWHVTLVKEGTHVCDGTLIHHRWVMSAVLIDLFTAPRNLVLKALPKLWPLNGAHIKLG